MNPLLQAVKIGTVFFWIVVGADVFGFIQMGEPLDFLLKTVGFGTFVVHLVEIAYFWLTFKHKSNNPVLDSLQILVFGVFHMIPLRNKQA
ncbi:hypothetical protein [Leptospira kmetyi]|uniref:DUF1145 domain-containing protein n=1 Tax=Leptospira kmetyi TaxID=408139 RepID=A0A2M9XV89_9LEPT|nr:hypothetical protein [Leptospira kmetyi]AYV57120.1 hypothetical protein EFP84_17465 [Leptospira kmetyi]EQA54721.1 PF06611 family protein [Leptospira kmetyi serovar Malaysia str. Bejo-Iso9]PJZ31841.1 hypothetical protein CH378_01115 [Leptospira kmetyi]PJZ43214.1 hypothetical protein CH370_01950 [Leptospira kmetyi]TGK21515.1 hypothetical protein EHO62_03640 [Leptospira kmetyi]